ncbi:MAG: hypothetical protein AB7G28_25430 [Pirellulales bacterium]
MIPEIRNEPFSVVLYGASRQHQQGTCYGDDIRALLDRVWPVIKQHQIANRGLNHVVYGPHDDVFAGVEADVADAAAVGLERREVRLDRYAYARHVGPYSLLPSACESLHQWIQSHGFHPVQPLVEKYGHWTDDQSQLETELIQALA